MKYGVGKRRRNMKPEDSDENGDGKRRRNMKTEYSDEN